MRNIFAKFRWMITIIGFLLVGAVLVNEFINPKGYENQEIVMYAQILPDGSMKIREERTVKFNGEFSRYSLTFPLKGYSAMADIAVADQFGSYGLVKSATDRPAGKYTVTAPGGGKNEYKIEWYFRAKDETKKFIIDYRVQNCVTVYQDIAELYWQFVGANRDDTIGKMTVTVTLPPGAARDQIKVWGHGPLSGEVLLQDSGNVRMTTTKLPPHRFMEGRIVFPTTLVPQAVKKVNQAALASIEKQEADFSRKTAQERQEAQTRAIVQIAIPVLGVTAVSWLYWRYGRRKKAEFFGDYYRELPGAYSPAEVSILFDYRKKNSAAFTATLMDLARRGYIRMEPVQREEERLGGLLGTSTREDVMLYCLKGADNSLRPHEIMLLGFLFNDVGAGQAVFPFSALQQYGSEYTKNMKRFMDDWFQTVRATAEEQGFFEQSKSVIGSFWLKLVALAFLIGAIGCGNSRQYQEFALSLGFNAVAFGLLASAGSAERRTVYGETQVAMWEAFKRFLKDFSNLDKAQLPQLILWEHYLVMAVVLGVAKEVLRQLPVVYPEIQDPDSEFGRNWGYYHSHRHYGAYRESTSFGGAVGGLGAISLLDSMQDTWTAAFNSVSASESSSSSGSGGGFSSGGGGGGGGSSSSAD